MAEQWTPQMVKQECSGRTPEQKKVIKHFKGSTGCIDGLLNRMTDQEYHQMVMARATGTDFKKKALNKIGLDEEQVNEIEPICLTGYVVDGKSNCWAKYSKELRMWLTTKYQISWIFFSDTEVYAYQYTFCMNDDTKSERTENYFYKDVTNFSAITETEEKWTAEKVSCTGAVTKWSNKNIDTTKMAIIVPGDRFECSATASDYFDRSISGMKAKLREKKNA